MAFDTKRLKTFKWLDDLAKNSRHSRMQNVLARFGSLYATNDIVLAKINYPEFEHIGDFEWLQIVHYLDADGNLLEAPTAKRLDDQFKDDRFLDHFFDDKFAALEYSIDPKVLKTGLKVFEINRINPVIYTSQDKLFLMGHNKDVSIRVCMMGAR